MFAGKTGYGISKVTEYKRLGKKVFIIRHGDDKRFDDEDKIKTHDGHTVGVAIGQVYKKSLPLELLEGELSKFDIIFIDHIMSSFTRTHLKNVLS